MREQLIEISSDAMLKLDFLSQNLDQFWTKGAKYPQFANEIEVFACSMLLLLAGV